MIVFSNNRTEVVIVANYVYFCVITTHFTPLLRFGRISKSAESHKFKRELLQRKKLLYRN